MPTRHDPSFFPASACADRLCRVMARCGLERVLSGLSPRFVAAECTPGLTANEPCWQTIGAVWSGQGD